MNKMGRAKDWVTFIKNFPQGVERPMGFKVKQKVRGTTCCWCGLEIFVGVEHIIPRSAGAPVRDIWNLAWACYPCNHERGSDIGPLSYEWMAKHRKPNPDGWMTKAFANHPEVPTREELVEYFKTGGEPLKEWTNFVNEVRAIPINQEKVDNIVGELMSQIENELEEYNPIPQPVAHFLKASTNDVFHTVDGKKKIITFEAASTKNITGRRFASEGWYNPKLQHVLIRLNGKRTIREWKTIFEQGGVLTTMLEDQLKKVLYHEMTHALDFPTKQTYDYEKIMARDMSELVKYMNDPREIRARMQEVVQDVLRVYRTYGEAMSKSRLFEVIQRSEAWKEAVAFLTSENKRKIIQASYRALSDEELI